MLISIILLVGGQTATLSPQRRKLSDRTFDFRLSATVELKITLPRLTGLPESRYHEYLHWNAICKEMVLNPFSKATSLMRILYLAKGHKDFNLITNLLIRHLRLSPKKCQEESESLSSLSLSLTLRRPERNHSQTPNSRAPGDRASISLQRWQSRFYPRSGGAAGAIWAGLQHMFTKEALWAGINGRWGT